MSFSVYAVCAAAKSVGIAPDAIEKLAEVLKRSGMPDPRHRKKYARFKQKCSFPRDFSIQPLLETPLYCDLYVSSDRMRGEEVTSFWSEGVADRRSHFHVSGRRSGSGMEQVLLEVLVSVKTRRQSVLGLTEEGLGDSISLHDLIERVAERGAQNHGWCEGDVAVAQDYYLNVPGEILATLADIHRRFRCVIATKTERWTELEAEVSLTQVPIVASIARQNEYPN